MDTCDSWRAPADMVRQFRLQMLPVMNPTEVEKVREEIGTMTPEQGRIPCNLDRWMRTNRLLVHSEVTAKAEFTAAFLRCFGRGGRAVPGDGQAPHSREFASNEGRLSLEAGQKYCDLLLDALARDLGNTVPLVSRLPLGSSDCDRELSAAELEALSRFQARLGSLQQDPTMRLRRGRAYAELVKSGVAKSLGRNTAPDWKSGCLDVAFLVPPTTVAGQDDKEHQHGNWRVAAWAQVSDRAASSRKLPKTFSQARMLFRLHSEQEHQEGDAAWLQPLLALEVEARDGNWEVGLYGYTLACEGAWWKTDNSDLDVTVARCCIAKWPRDCLPGEDRSVLLERMMAVPGWYARTFAELCPQEHQPPLTKSEASRQVLLPCQDGKHSDVVLQMVEDCKPAPPVQREHTAVSKAASDVPALPSAPRSVFKVYDERTSRLASRRWWMQLAFVPGCRVVALGKQVLMLEYPYMEETDDWTVAHTLAVMRQLLRAHSGDVREDLQRARAVAKELSLNEEVEELDSLLEKEEIGPVTHNDIRLSNIVFTRDASQSCLIAWHMAGVKYYRSFNCDISDGKRHKDAESDLPTSPAHDVFSLAYAFQYFGCENPLWEQGVARMLTAISKGKCSTACLTDAIGDFEAIADEKLWWRIAIPADD